MSMRPEDDELGGIGPSGLAAAWGMPVNAAGAADTDRVMGWDTGKGDVTAVAVRSGDELTHMVTFSNPTGPGHDLIRDTVDRYYAKAQGEPPRKTAAQQKALLHEIAAQARDRELERPIPLLLTHLIRWALDPSIPLDELALLKLADHHGMQLLAKCRAHGVNQLPGSVWRELRNNQPVLWRILMAERQAA